MGYGEHGGKHGDFEIRGGVLVRYHGDDPYVDVPTGVRAVGEGAFRDCRSLREVTLPAGLREVRDEAFAWCANLGEVRAPESLARVGLDCFKGTPFYRFYSENEGDWGDFLILGRCLVKARRNIRRAHIPEGVETIAADAFFEHVLLSELEFPRSLREIGWRAFADCTGLHEVRVPGNVKRLGWHCFKGCSRLLTVVLEEGVEELENGVFSTCRRLPRASLPASVSKIPGWCFFGCSALARVDCAGILAEVGDWAFSGCSELRHLDLGEGLERVGVEAFYECTNLSVALPESLRAVDRRAFSRVHGIEALRLPAGLEHLGEGAFAGCRGLCSVDGHDAARLEEIGPEAFAGCGHLRELALPNDLKAVGDEAFLDCRELGEVRLPAVLERIGARAFAGCRSLERVDVAEGPWAVKPSQDGADAPVDEGSDGLSGQGGRPACRPRLVPFLPGLLFLGREAFASCPRLGSVRLPGPPAQGDGAYFSGCEALADAAGFVVLDGVCYGHVGCGRRLGVPAGTRVLAAGAFRDAEDLAALSLPESVCAVGPAALSGCRALERLVLPSALARLDETVLLGTAGLLVLEAPGIGPEAFVGGQRRAALLGFCGAEHRYGATRAAYEETALGCRRELICAAVDHGLGAQAGFFLRRRALDRELFAEVLERAQRARQMEIVAALLEYRRQGIPGDAGARRFSI